MRVSQPIAIAIFALIFCGCEGRFDPGDPPPFSTPQSTSGTGRGVGIETSLLVGAPVFEGVSALVPGDEMVRVEWEAGVDDEDDPSEILYHVYVAAGPGDQDLSVATAVTSKGATHHDVVGIENGVAVFVVVRSVDTDGNEDSNRVEWVAVPNPVRYVRAGAPAGGDGKSPSTAYATLAQAIPPSIQLDGVNLYLSRGLYVENAILFPGMFLQGGFTEEFHLDDRDPIENVTRLLIPRTPQTVSVITVLSSSTLSGADGLELDGGHVADNGVKIKDAFFRITNCGIRNAKSHGIEMRSTAIDRDLIEGTIRSCGIVGNGAEGIFVSGLTKVLIDDNLIADNTNEGIESQWIVGATGIDVWIDITRNVIRDNGEEGVDLDFAAVAPDDPSASLGARVRALLSNNRIIHNGSTGLEIDVDFVTSDGIDFRVRIEDNVISANRLGGVLIDADAQVHFRFARNVLTANGSHGLTATGSADGPVLRCLNCRIMGNSGAGLLLSRHIVADVRQCVFRGNLGAAVTADRAAVELVGCVLMGHSSKSSGASLRFCLLEGADRSQPGTGNLIGKPTFERHPQRIYAIPRIGSGAVVPVDESNEFVPGDTAELFDDGVPLQVTNVLMDAIVVDPEPDRDFGPGDTLARHAPDADVHESEALVAGSPGIDAGHRLEVDADDSRADVGPAGGHTPGNVGIETGLRPEQLPLQLLRSAPTPGLLVTSSEWSLTFNRVVAEDFVDAIVLELNGSPVPEPPVIDAVDSDVLISADVEFDPGDVFTIEMPPVMHSDPALSHPSDVVLRYIGALEVLDADDDLVDANGDAGSAQTLDDSATLVLGVVGAGDDRDFYRIEVAAGKRLDVEVIALTAESPLIPRLTILASDGETVLDTTVGVALEQQDPTLSISASSTRTFFIVVESADGSGTSDHVYSLVVVVR